MSADSTRREDWSGADPEAVKLGGLLDRLHYGRLGRYISIARTIPSWTRGEEAVELARASRAMPRDALIVELGSFVGCSTVLLGGGRRVAGSGAVHSVDPFDASGETFSVPVYRAIEASFSGTLRDEYERNVARAGLAGFVATHVGRATDVASEWSQQIDMLFMDGDQSRDGVRAAYDAWVPFLRVGGLLVVHSAKAPSPREVAEDHDGPFALVSETIVEPRWGDTRFVQTTMFARKLFD